MYIYNHVPMQDEKHKKKSRNSEICFGSTTGVNTIEMLKTIAIAPSVKLRQ